jgi:hypothetical protein
MLPQPRLRFLFAVGPGTGKTIMAGLLIAKRYTVRGRVPRSGFELVCEIGLMANKMANKVEWKDSQKWFRDSG